MSSRKNTSSAILSFLAMTLLLIVGCAAAYMTARLFSGALPIKETMKPVKLYPIIVVDAGHGGIDGGASSSEGILEKDLNLSVAKKLEAMLHLAGMDCIMTRREDMMLVDDSVTSHRKMHDLKNRLAIVEQASIEREALFVSIHMNKFESAKVSGLQVWHAADEVSRQFAASVQTYARTFLNPENHREIKRTTSSIYILEHAAHPSILVECGFLSNPAECAKLSTDTYQNALASIIFAGIMEEIAKMDT